MAIVKEKEWQSWKDHNQDAYGNACIKVAEKVMELLDDADHKEFDAHQIICEADDLTDAGGITGFMAGAIASMVSQCHSRGEEFRLMWNKSYGIEKTKTERERKFKEMENEMTNSEKKYVVVTTDNQRRGVFGGYLLSHEGDVVILKDARMAVYWSSQTKGVLGLASIGPQEGSRISPPVPEITLNGVTSVSTASSQAQKQWEIGLWG